MNVLAKAAGWGLAALGALIGIAAIGPAACPADGGLLCAGLAGGIGCALAGAAGAVAASLRKR